MLSVIYGNRFRPKRTGLLEAFGIEYPGVAQMVERVVWDHEAAGSRPVTRTIFHSIFILIVAQTIVFLDELNSTKAIDTFLAEYF